jgi:hypothetical protein
VVVRDEGGNPAKVKGFSHGTPPMSQGGAFDERIDLRIPAGHTDRLERLCRYALRPTVAQDRLRLTAEGQVVLQLRHPWSDGTTHLLFDPLELLERLAVLIPRPRINLILYHGILPFLMKSVLSAVLRMADKSRLDESAGRGWPSLGAMGFECREPPPHAGHDRVLGRSTGRRGWRIGVAGSAERGDGGPGGRLAPGWG